MELNIHNETSVKDLQGQFSKYYPYLQIQFFRTTYSDKQPGSKTAQVKAEERLMQLMKLYKPVQVNIDEETTVSGLQKIFADIGLTILLCRKFGTFWIQTSLTDDWTLDRQNSEALMLSVPGEKECGEN